MNEDDIQIERIGYSEPMYNLLLIIRTETENLEQHPCDDLNSWAKNLYLYMGTPTCYFFVVLINNVVAGFIYCLPVHANSLECHQLFFPFREYRKHAVKAARIVFEKMKEIASHITHFFAYVPQENRRALIVDYRIGFKRLCTLDKYNNGNNVELLLLTR